MTPQEETLVIAAFNLVALVLRAFGDEAGARIVDETLVGLQIEDRAA